MTFLPVPGKTLDMTIIEHYQRVVAYDLWANREALLSLRIAESPVAERALALMSHIVATERVWLERINDPAQKPPVWPQMTLEEIEQQLQAVSRDWLEILTGGEAALEREVEYHNSKGEHWVNTVGDVLQHVMMHGTYHRGQIATLLRQHGAAPAYTDYIEAVRRGRL
jgi:uncharacterized damage-inducible protein DinB